MRTSLLRAAILGFLIGPAPLEAETPDAEPPDGERRTAGAGHTVRGIDFYVWDEDAREAQAWGAELAGASQEPAEWAHWRAVAARSAALPPILGAENEAELEAWLQPEAEDVQRSFLGLVLCLLPGLDRTCLISEWATSTREPTRRALARALAAPFEAVGVRAVLEQLQQDPSPEVRQLAHAAAASRSASLA